MDQRKQTVYVPAEMIEELRNEAQRLERSVSWVIQRAWNLARQRIRQYPTQTSDDSNS